MKNYSAKFVFLSSGSIISVEDAAEYLNCSTRRVRKLLQEKRLVGVKKGKSWAISWPLQYTLGMRGPLLKIAGKTALYYCIKKRF